MIPAVQPMHKSHTDALVPFTMDGQGSKESTAAAEGTVIVPAADLALLPRTREEVDLFMRKTKLQFKVIVFTIACKGRCEACAIAKNVS